MGRRSKYTLPSEGPHADLWEAYWASGDPDLQRQLTEAYIEIVRASAYRLAGKMYGCDHPSELYGAGWEGLNKAVSSFDESSGTSFESWAYPKVRWAILDQARLDGPYTRGQINKSRAGEDLPGMRSIEEPAFQGEWKLLDTLEAPGLNGHDHESLPLLMKALTDQERAVLFPNLKGVTLAEVGKVIQLTESRCCQIRQKAIRRMKALAEELKLVS